VKRLLPRGTKIGHAGTLDPLASGVLVALIGKGTKLSDRVMGLPKQYEASIRLGASSATDDAEGPLTRCERFAVPDEATVRAALSRFVGSIEQMPPAFSALKVGGRRACDRTRDGETVVLKPRTIRIDSIELLSYAWPDVAIRMDCGKGTYVRSLARDVGAALGMGGYLSALRRTRVGPFTAARGATKEQLIADGVEQFLLPLDVIEIGAPRSS
jgi:tRNA pseudouridine55 synthase